MIKLFLLATIGVVATFAATTTTVTPEAYDYYRNNPYNNFRRNDPYNRNTYNPYYRNNGYYDQNNKNDPYNRNQYDPYNRNQYDPYHKSFGNNYYNRSTYNYDYRKNYVPGAEGYARILRFDNTAQPDGSYVYSYETDNGISAQQEGFPIGTPESEYAVGVRGYYQYTSPEGRQIITRYVADDNGYRPVGSSFGDEVYQSRVVSDPVITPLAKTVV